MTGPPYPRYETGTEPGGNQIGAFVIGVSPIGTISPFDWWQTVISQYANSPVITQLIDNFFQYIDPTGDLDSFFDLLFNVDTAQGYGLDVWGRIVGIDRTVFVANPDVYFGFQEATGPLSGTFGQAPFHSGLSLTSNFDLSDTAYRTLILAKALANISDGSIPSINQLLLNLFSGQGDCYVIDNEDMTMIYRFEFNLSSVQLAIVSTAGVLPKPAGVSATVVQGF